MAELYSLEKMVEQWNTRSPTDLITTGTVRHYRDQLLMDGPERIGIGQRYSDLHLKQIRVIRLMRRNGVSVEEIADLLWDT